MRDGDCSEPEVKRIVFFGQDLDECIALEDLIRRAGFMSCFYYVQGHQPLDPLLLDTANLAVVLSLADSRGLIADVDALRSANMDVPIIVVSRNTDPEVAGDLCGRSGVRYVEGLNAPRIQMLVSLALRHSMAPRRDSRLSLLFEAVAQGSSNAVWGKDAQGRYIYANEAACQLFGRAESDLIGLTDYDFLPESEALSQANAELIVTRGEQIRTGRVTLTTPFGPISVWTLLGTLRVEGGVAAGTFCIANTADEFRRRDAITQFHNTLLQRIIDRCSIASNLDMLCEAVALQFPPKAQLLVLIDPDVLGEQRVASRTTSVALRDATMKLLLRLLGLFEERLMKEGVVHACCGLDAVDEWAEVLSLDSSCRNMLILPILGGGGESLGHFCALLPDGGAPYSELSSALEMVLRLIGFSIDLHLRDQQLMKFKLAVEQSPNSILITNSDAEIEYVNGAFTRTCGYRLDEVKGRNPRFLKSGLTPSECYISLWSALREGRVWEGEFTNLTKNGDILIEKEIFAPIKQGDGLITHFLCIKEDVTRRRRDEDELHRYRQSLENLVAEKTRQLRDEKERAESALRVKSNFLANMSHEIRTPLNAIVGLSHLLVRQTPRSDQLGKLERITDAAEHLLTVINDILDISKIEAGKLILEERAFNLEQLLCDMASLVADRAREKGVELIVDIRDAPREVVGDRTRLGQALLNYLGNAVKFTSAGTITASVNMLHEEDDFVFLHFEVEDTGIGIASDDIARLFEPFQQADDSITRRFGGTGLGLAICRNLVSLMHGTVGVESELGRGSRFWFTARMRKAQEADVGESTDLRSRPLRILVVDDIPLTRTVLSAQLSRLGVRVEQAGSGSAAIRVVSDCEREGDPIAVVFIDLNMPDMDGISAVRVIRSLPLRVLPRCVLVTSSNEVDLPHAEAFGFSGYLQKPVSSASIELLLAQFEGFPPAVVQAGDRRSGDDAGLVLARDFRNARILLVEDDLINQMVAQEMLIDVGIEADIADNGRVALEMVATKSYDIILMDMQMPEMDGLEATRRIRHDLCNVDVVIIAMTANAFQDDIDRCVAVGMNDFLAKPTTPERLYEAIRRALRAGPSTVLPV